MLFPTPTHENVVLLWYLFTKEHTHKPPKFNRTTQFYLDKNNNLRVTNYAQVILISWTGTQYMLAQHKQKFDQHCFCWKKRNLSQYCIYVNCYLQKKKKRKVSCQDQDNSTHFRKKKPCGEEQALHLIQKKLAKIQTRKLLVSTGIGGSCDTDPKC